METCWNVTIQDTSPVIKYTPYADGGPLGWTGVFTGGEQVVNGMIMGSGDTEHVTGGPAEAQIVFNGTAIYLKGATMGNMQYEVELDGRVTPGQPSGDLLASFTKLSSNQPHNLILRAKPQASNDWLGLQSAIITVGTGLTGAASASMIKEENDAAWIYGPGFSQAVNPVTTATMRRSTTIGDWAALTFSGHSVIVHGTTNIDHGLYSVELDGETRVFNGTSRAIIGDTVLFQQSGMDSLKTHVLNITKLDDRALDIDYAEIVTVQGGTKYDPTAESANTDPTTTSSGPNIAVIVAGVLGGIIALLVAGILIWYLRGRRGQKQASTEEGSAAAPAAPPATDGWKPEMTMAAPVSAIAKPSSGPRVRFGELARPGLEDTPVARSETPPDLRPMPSILRRQDSNNSTAPLLPPARVGIGRRSDDESIASTANSGFGGSTSSLAVAPPSIQRTSSTSSFAAFPVRPPRPPVDPFVSQDVPKFPIPDLSFSQPAPDSAQPDATPDGDTVASPTLALQGTKIMGVNKGSRFSDSTADMPNPFEDTASAILRDAPSPTSPRPDDLKLQTDDLPSSDSELRSAGQARRDLLAALETDQVTTISRSGTRKVGLPSNPRAGFSRE